MNSELKFIVIGNLTYPYSGAPTSRVHAYAKGIVEKGYKALVICTGTPFENKMPFDKSGYFEGVEYIYSANTYVRHKNFFFRNLLRVYGSLNGILNIINLRIKYNNFAVLEFHTKFSFELVFYLITRLFRIKVIREQNEVPEIVKSHIDNPFKKFLHKYRAKLYDGVIVISNYLKNYFSDLIKKNAKVLLIPILVDLNRFHENTSKEIVNKYQDYIAYCGYMIGDKDGVDILIDSFNIIANKYNNLNLLLIGGGPPADLKRLTEKVKNLNLEDRIYFTGEISQEQVPEYLINAEILVLARPDNLQAKGGFPTKLGEYLATGNPVVVTEVGELNHYLEDNKNVFFARPSDTKSFAKRLEYVISNKAVAQTVGKNGQKIASKYFNYEKAADYLIDFINLLNKK